MTSNRPIPAAAVVPDLSAMQRARRLGFRDAGRTVAYARTD